ncbi:hypothetical protein ORI20_26655 [Mycobacterium sp. CVI_P3]|uniref:DUF202 domain-containing protein n=1 Tax=Mycobacterium pinniadriaticum TaxID=2994102 RepID=A0ABT3SL95_9MYCO|nr:hypothetical protein [Mycobacterium pinniadriaticum]MCX2933857.1 hypothetical protein [Mycobacterium pinniadriaticum]MCX2940290.1 hypothetical protein [Mycobacterium pinniadriaticum]
MDTRPGKLWGSQYPFERNHVQRSMTLAGLAGIFAVAVILLVHADVTSVLGISLICVGVVSALAAASRHRYVQETQLGYAILRTRGGWFVLGSAVAFAIVSVVVTLLIVLE